MRWPAPWFQHTAATERILWRGVEAQHRVATLRLVDDLNEQHILEELLEDSKPARPPHAPGQHYLLWTPFRYTSPWPSRFRRAGDAGAWYGADSPATVAAELAHWRGRFVADAEALHGQAIITEHTFFQARFAGTELDLTAKPWSRHRRQWRDPLDYAHCHALADQARSRQPAAQSIRYESARVEGAGCQAVFDPAALRMAPGGRQQTWLCKITRERVLLSHDTQHLEFELR